MAIGLTFQSSSVWPEQATVTLATEPMELN